MLVRPLAVTNVDWTAFVAVCTKKLGISPTRGLDKQGLSVESPASFLHAISMDNKEGITGLEHLSASFIIVCPKEIAYKIRMETNLSVVMKEADDEVVAILSGNMLVWRDAVLYDGGSKVRWILNRCYILLRDVGFGPLWSKCTSKMLHDDTFKLEST